MLLTTYENIINLFKSNNNYMNFDMLRECGVTITQINELLDRRDIYKISRGWYGLFIITKDNNYKLIELSLVNPKIIICNQSAAFYHGLLDKEPEQVSFATKRTDRSKMEMYFPVSRHYFSDTNFDDDIHVVTTDVTDIKITSVDKTVCDCIRFDYQIGTDITKSIVERYLISNNKNISRLEYYAMKMRISKYIDNYLQEE